MSNPRAFWLAILVGVMALAAPARALEPKEVLVVANANAVGSQALAKYYCLARGIPDAQLLVVQTTAADTITRQEYDKGLRDAIRAYLTDEKLRDQIKCVVVVWGVPVRVLGTELSADQREMVKLYTQARDRAVGRVELALAMLNTIGQSFPAPKTASLKPVADLFDVRTAPAAGARDTDAMAREFASTADAKEKAVAAIKDVPQRQIAVRQLAALRADMLGLANLVEHLTPEKIAGVPTREQVKAQIASVQEQMTQMTKLPESPDNVRKGLDLVAEFRGGIGTFNFCRFRIDQLNTDSEDASVDSELALLREEKYSLRGNLPNPLSSRVRQLASRPAGAPKTCLMTARIDGPTAKDALQLVKNSLAAEKNGLEGTFYIDAGGKYPPYDKYLTNLARLVKENTKIPVVLDERPTLFAPNSCPNAALYIGWYSLRKYVPAFTWVPGAVAWHIASFEAEHLRDPKSEEWCVKMIQGGVAATLGAVNEPLLGAFPQPEEFFLRLLSGQCVGECYWQTVPDVSWRLTLIADPLYNPFRARPQVPAEAIDKLLRQATTQTGANP